MVSKFKSFAVLAAAACIFLPLQAGAQQILELSVEYGTDAHEVLPTYYEKNGGEAVLFIDEPFFKKVTFLKLEEPSSFRERIDRLVYGITTDVAPEYDHYGYEIRRYMQSVGNAAKFNDPAFIEQQIKNLNTADIILEYWKKKLKADMEEIEGLIEERQETSSNRTMFKYNRGVANAFLIECKSWIDNNRAVLKYLQDVGPAAYRYDAEKGQFFFKNIQHFRDFSAIYKSKIKALTEMRSYLPFRMMVY